MGNFSPIFPKNRNVNRQFGDIKKENNLWRDMTLKKSLQNYVESLTVSVQKYIFNSAVWFDN